MNSPNPNLYLEIHHWLDGRKFEGQWKDNKMHGDGVFSWADGFKYLIRR